MPSQSLADLIGGAYSLKDFNIEGDDNGDAGDRINRAMAYVSQQSRANGLLFVPPGIYRFSITPLSLISNVTLFGMGSVTVFKLGDSCNIDLVRGNGISGFRMRDIRLDGNRANQSSTGNGIHLVDASDCVFDNVEVVSCRADGWWIDQCSRLKLNNCQASDNGRHGFSLNLADFCLLMAVDAYDNCRVSTAGVGDGINLDLAAHDNVIIAPNAYESALTGGRQGYGVREALAGACYRNLVIGNPQGNATGGFLMGSDSLAISPAGILSGGLGLGTVSPHASALFDMVSTRQGARLPCMTTAQKNGIQSPAAGLAVYDTDAAKLCVWTGSAWETVTSA